jgi:hypothetical protein
MELRSFLRSLPDKPDDIVIDHMVWLRGISDDSVMAIVQPMIDRLEALRDEFDAMVTAVIQAEEHLGSHLTEGCLDAIWHVARPEPDVIHVRNTMRRGGGEHQGGRAICFRRRLISIAGWTAPVFVLEYAGSIEPI